MIRKSRVEIDELDKIDRRLLQLLQRNNLLTNLDLAERAFISPPTCLRRIRRLRNGGIIVADVSLLDPSRLGRNLFVYVEAVLERQDEKSQLAFEKKMQGVDEVMECYMVSGHADFIILVQVADMDAYHRFVRSVLTADQTIRNFRSLFAMNRSKYRTEINLT